MRFFSCSCGATVFFENSRCTACGGELGWCPGCRDMTRLTPAGGAWRCGREGCGVPLVKCHNYAAEQVCNRCCPPPTDPGGPDPLCDYCRFNHTIPDLSLPGNRERWRKLENGKRRLLYSLDQLGLPYGSSADGIDPPLRFDFRGDPIPASEEWWSSGDERVRTGHADGLITINIVEADAVEREKARVHFQEAHRTVIGHFRHEIGHYYWQMLVQDRCEPDFVALFGSHEQPPYAEAQRRYYQQGPPPDWSGRYVSPYAAMHPWEDFAESFATYLGMASVLDTARHSGLVPGLDPSRAPLADLVDAYTRVGLVINELNRSMGLLDLVPEVLTPAVVEKLAFVDGLVRAAAGSC